MPSGQNERVQHRPNSKKTETIRFLREHLPIARIVSATRGRFTEINDLLLRVLINRHDQSHQLRTAIYTAQFMRDLGFDHRATIQATAGALTHDVGYNQPDEAETAKQDGYNDGAKVKFHKHALKGAQEAEATLRSVLQHIREGNEINPQLRELLSYKDEEGNERLIDEEDVNKIVEAILNHNDYGKDDESYDPGKISKGALMVQLFDKLDIVKKRVYPEHMIPEAFVEDSRDYDPKYFHRVVPYCVQHYEPKMDPESGTMEMTYHVDLTAFKTLMKRSYPDFQYTEADFIKDFERAYTKNCRIAAEAVGVILDNPTFHNTLTVNLQFPNGNNYQLDFARPNREIYERQVESLRASISELTQGKKRAA